MKRVCSLSLIILALFFAACSSTKESTGVWFDKEKIKGKAYDNFFVIVMTADIEARVKLENEIAATIISRGHKAIKSYEVLPADLKDPKPPAVDALIEKIKASDCDAVFLASLLDKNEDVGYTSGVINIKCGLIIHWPELFFAIKKLNT